MDEFVQNGDVKGRAIATIIPAADVSAVFEGALPPVGRFRIDRLRGDDDEFLRLWYNFGGDQLLIHLDVGASASDGTPQP